MTLQIRRVVTGHDESGRSEVRIDEAVRNISSGRPGQQQAVIWTTHGFPVDNDDNFDGSLRPTGTALEGGSVFRVVEFGPGVAPRNHRTNSIDYGIVLAGEIEMRLDTGTVRLKAGDVVVQRGTIHEWVNNGSEPCVMAFILIDAKPAGGGALDAVG